MSLGKGRCCDTHLNRNVIGAQGFIGNYGSIGGIGLTGADGVTGPQGASGLCYQGYKGYRGAQGSQGSLDGAQGAPGPSGPTVLRSNPIISSYITTQLFTTVTFDDVYTLLGSNTIDIASAGDYIINWQLSENWSDPLNAFYVDFLNNDNSQIYTPYVFTDASPCVLTSNTQRRVINSVGSDKVFLDVGNYNIIIWQKTTGSPITVPTANIKFSITLTPI
jgi:hypothetical protein